MSWDGKALVLLAAIWGGLAVLYVTVINMMPGARGWSSGAAVFLVLVLAVWLAERRAAAAATRHERDRLASGGEVPEGHQIIAGGSGDQG